MYIQDAAGSNAHLQLHQHRGFQNTTETYQQPLCLYSDHGFIVCFWCYIRKKSCEIQNCSLYSIYVNYGYVYLRNGLAKHHIYTHIYMRTHTRTHARTLLTNQDVFVVQILLLQFCSEANGAKNHMTPHLWRKYIKEPL